uniref:Uncharacterized protein n=1 Tax=Castor canadensis TaxID=51338 RepID=A0A8C0XM47_CASCN
MAAHQNLASKICCLCCTECEEPQVTDHAKVPSQTQEKPSWTGSLQVFKNELNKQKSKYTVTKSLILQKLHLPSSSDLEDMDIYTSQRGFHKRKLSRYRQEHWPFQPCLIGRP